METLAQANRTKSKEMHNNILSRNLVVVFFFWFCFVLFCFFFFFVVFFWGGRGRGGRGGGQGVHNKDNIFKVGCGGRGQKDHKRIAYLQWKRRNFRQLSPQMHIRQRPFQTSLRYEFP